MGSASVSPIPTQHTVVMATNLKRYKFTVSDRGSNFTEIIEAVNPPQAKRFAEARYPGAKLYGFNQIYS